MGVFDSYEWVYWFHIFVGAPLLAVIPLLVIMNQNVDNKIIKTWYYILIAVALGMIGYHGLKLLKMRGIIKS